MIIALKGPSQCGKSTLAGMLEKELSARGFNVKRTAFSDFVREEIVAAYEIWFSYFARPQGPNHDMPLDQKWLFKKKLVQFLDEHVGDISRGIDLPTAAAVRLLLEARPALFSSREIQQWWGQDYRRGQDPLYWIKKSFVANAEFILGSGNNILIEESCRQQNEGHYVQALGGVVLDLKPLPSPTASEEAAMSHSVEQAAMSWKGDIEIDMGYVFRLAESDKNAWIQDEVPTWLRLMGLPATALPTER